jgi:hypothetical protein
MSIKLLFCRFLFSLGIRHVGVETAKDLSNKFITFNGTYIHLFVYICMYILLCNIFMYINMKYVKKRFYIYVYENIHVKYVYDNICIHLHIQVFGLIFWKK